MHAISQGTIGCMPASQEDGPAIAGGRIALSVMICVFSGTRTGV
jgi:hypothetical protein